jgi:hypothetical protein
MVVGANGGDEACVALSGADDLQLREGLKLTPINSRDPTETRKDAASSQST